MLRWSSYEATPEPASVATSQAMLTGIPLPMDRPAGRLARGAVATGAVVSDRTVTGAAPVTPLTVAMAWPEPGVVATKCPLASIDPRAGSIDQLSWPAPIGTGL